jgi:hypothetical protein
MKQGFKRSSIEPSKSFFVFLKVGLFWYRYVWWKKEYGKDWTVAIDELFGSTEWQKKFEKFENRELVNNMGGVLGVKGSAGLVYTFRWWLSNTLKREGLLDKYERFGLLRIPNLFS